MSALLSELESKAAELAPDLSTTMRNAGPASERLLCSSSSVRATWHCGFRTPARHSDEHCVESSPTASLARWSTFRMRVEFGWLPLPIPVADRATRRGVEGDSPLQE